MNASKSLIEKVTQKIRYGTVLYHLQGRLSLLGLTIEPYFLDKEFFTPGSDLNVNITPKLQPLTTDFLEKHEIAHIYSHPERNALAMSYKIHDRISDGCLCYGVKHCGEIIAYTWCDLNHCNHKPLQFNLKETEVYLFDMYTLKAYRGKNIAPYMRFQLYLQLQEMGRTDFFSITEAFNSPSIRFKKKLGARPTKLYLHLKVGKLFERNIMLRKYY